MKIKFTTGEMAKFHEISKQTLIYYDKIGLFKPAEIDVKTGYRHYNINQNEKLSVILLLKNIGMSLNEIKDYLKITSTEKRISLLQNQEEMVIEKISLLDKSRVKLNSIITSLKSRVNIVPFESGIKYIDKRFIISEKVAPPFDLYQGELALDKLFKKTKSRDDTDIHEIIFFTEFSDSGEDIFKRVAQEVKNDSEEHLNEGYYAYIYHKGNFEAIKDSRSKLIDEIKKSEFKIAGNAIEKLLLDGLAVADQDQYILEIQIPVTKKQAPMI